MLGLGLVPTTTEWSDPTNGTGSLQDWAEDAYPGADSRDYDPLDQERVAVLDYVMANTDRHQENYLTSADERPAP